MLPRNAPVNVNEIEKLAAAVGEWTSDNFRQAGNSTNAETSSVPKLTCEYWNKLIKGEISLHLL